MRHCKGLWALAAASVFVVRAAHAQPSEGSDEADAAAESDESADAEGAAAEGGASATEETGEDETAVGKAAASSSGDAGMDGATYAVRLRDLEQRIDELKEQIRRSHTRLSLLSDTILSGGVGGARAEILFKNEMSNAFRLTRALFVLDGAVQYNKQDDSGALSEQAEIPVFNGSVPTGDHTLQVLIQLRGHGYGVFSYLRGYKFEVKSSHSFTITEGKTIDLQVIAYEKGGVTTPLEQRPAIRYVENVRSGGAAAPAPSKKKKDDGGGSGASGSFSVGTGGN